MKYKFSRSERFIEAVLELPKEIDNKLDKCLKLLEENPRHPSLKTYKIKGAQGDFQKDVFEAYIDKKYRLTWEYGETREVVVLRNCGIHDECLNSP